MENKNTETTLSETVRTKWESIFKSSEAKEFFQTDHSERVQKKVGKYIAYQDKKLDGNKKSLSIKATSSETVLLPFDDNKINFYNTLKDFQIIAHLSADGTKICSKFDENDSPHVILATFTPAFPYHFLFPLFHRKKLVQAMTLENLKIGLNIMNLIQAEDFRMVYQSTGGGSTVNQFHFQSIFMRDIGFEDNKFPAENAKAEKIDRLNSSDVETSLVDHGLQSFKFSIKDFEHKDKLAESVNALVEYLMKNNIPHNILLSEIGKAVYVVPRIFLGNLDQTVLVLGGFTALGLCKARQIDTEDLTEEYTYKKIESFKVPEDQLKELIELVKNL